MEEDHWYVWSIELRWPHQGMIIGFEAWEPTEEHSYLTVKVHFLCISISYESGYEEPPY